MRSVLLASCVLFLACSGTNPLPGSGAGGELLNPSAGDCSTRDDLNGCACATPREIRACSPLWVGEPRGNCISGQQVCEGGGSTEIKTYTWSACTGYQNCASTHDGKLPDGGTLGGQGGYGAGLTHDGQGGYGAGLTHDGQGGYGAGLTHDGQGGGNGGWTGGQGGYGAGLTHDGQGGGANAGSTGQGGYGAGLTHDGQGGRAGSGSGQGGSTNLAGGAGAGQGGHAGGTTHDGDYCDCPGLKRWCDDAVYCNWGKQTCLPDGSWGPCVEVKTRPAVCPPPQHDNWFDWECCEQNGLCCAGEDNNHLIGQCSANGCPAVSADLQ